jgi:predicted MFS family arabinose efflux permease
VAHQRDRRILIGFFVAGFALWAQLFAVQPILPDLAADFATSASAASAAISAATLGLALAVIPWSMAADRIGTTAVMRISVVATAVIGLGSAFAPGLTGLLVLRFALGVALAGVPAVAMAYLTEVVSLKALPGAAGLYVAGNTVGGLTGRVLAGPLADLGGWRLGVGVVALVGIVASVLFVVLIPPSRRVARPVFGVRVALRAIGDHLTNRNLLAVYLSTLVLMGTFTALFNVVPFQVAGGEQARGLLSSLISLTLIFGTVGSSFAGRVVQRLGRPRAIAAGSALAGAGLVEVALAGGLWVVPGLILFTFGCFLANAVLYGWVGLLARTGRNQSVALFQLSNQTGNTVVGTLAAVVFTLAGWPVMIAALLTLLVVVTAAASIRFTRIP